MLIDQFNLDPTQYKAVTYTSGPLLVYAGPGAGKTRTLAARTACLVEQGTNPNGIYLATFTRKARAEMQARLSEILEPDTAKRVNVMTIDATAYRILKAMERVREVNLSRQFRVADDETLYQLFRETLTLTGFESVRLSAIQAWKEIREWKGRGDHPAEIDSELAPLFGKFEERLAEAQLWDVADLVPKAIEALDKYPELAAAFNVQAFLLDEFQDTAPVQFKFIQKLLGDCRNFFAVGAPSQSIYGFRQADPQRLVSLMKTHFGELAIARLSVNYRSGRKIFEACTSMIGAAPDIEDIHTVKESGEVYLSELENEAAEANFVADAIMQIRASKPDLHWGDFAVLFRSWRQSNEIQNALSRIGLPFQIMAGNRRAFWQTPEVVALTGYLRAIQSIREAQGANPKLDGALDVILNQPPRGIGPTSHNMILNGASELTWERYIAAISNPALRPQVRTSLRSLFELLVDLADSPIQHPREMAQEVIIRTGWLEAIAEELDFNTIRTLLEEKYLSAADRFTSIPALLTSAYQQMTGGWNADGVILSSIHSAKGMEWPVVFLIGMNEGLLPSAQAETETDLEEEARLAHVATSRAMDMLFCTWVRNRQTSGRSRPAKPSRFLSKLKPIAKEVDDDSFTYPGYNPPPDHSGPFSTGSDASSSTFFGLPGDL